MRKSERLEAAPVGSPKPDGNHAVTALTRPLGRAETRPVEAPRPALVAVPAAGLDSPARPPFSALGSDPLEESTAQACLTVRSEHERPGRRLGRGDSVGRYLILSELGAGGMGVVYAAYDPELDRQIAVKLLHPRESGEMAQRLRRRMAREARALAKLSHPNIVVLYDAGQHDEQLFLAMELVKGCSARAYCSREPRPQWQEILELYLAAGRGLAAAHRAGLIHRDFKPDNVLIGDDGRARVADFGIAALDPLEADSLDNSLADADFAELDPLTAESVDLEATEPDAGVRDFGNAAALAETRPAPERLLERLDNGPLTATGMLLGTPMYMAPEQQLGGLVDFAADQYSFCAALYSSLCGVKPFPVRSGPDAFQELLACKLEQRFTPPPPGSEVPDWLLEVVHRGMSARADHRWPSLDALLTALSREPKARWQRRLVSVGLALAAVIGVTMGLAGWLTGDRSASVACPDGNSELVGVWDDAIKTDIEAVFLATSQSHAAATYERVSSVLDEYAADWAAMRGEACHATFEARTQSQQAFDRRMRCLDRRKLQLSNLAAALADNPDGQVLAQGIQAAMTLPLIADCADVEALSAAVPLPEDSRARARVEALGKRLDQLTTLRHAGRYTEASDLAGALIDESRSLDYSPLRAKILYEAGLARAKAGASKEAESLWRDAIAVGAKAKDDALLAQAWGHVIALTADSLGQPKEALRWQPVAAMLVDRAGDDRVRAEVSNLIAGAYSAAGLPEEAARLHREALDIRRRLLPPDHPDIAESMSRLASRQAFLEQCDEAKTLARGAFELGERAYGSDHPMTATRLAGLAFVISLCGEERDATPYYERALAIRRAALPPEHPEVAEIFAAVGTHFSNMQAHDRGIASLRTAVAIREKAFDPEHPQTAQSRVDLAIALFKAQQYDEIVPLFDRAMASYAARLPEAHPRVVHGFLSYGVIASDMGDFDKARQYLQQAVAAAEQTFGKDHSETARTLTQLGRLEERSGNLDRGLELHRNALAIYEKALHPHHPKIALTHSYIGLALENKGELLAAYETTRRATTIWEKGYSYVDHEHFVNSMITNAHLLEKLNRAEEARAGVERAIAYAKKHLGPKHTTVAYGSLIKVAMERESGGYQAARSLAEQAVAIYESLHGAEHPATVDAYAVLGRALIYVDEHERARSYLERALAINSKLFGEDSSQVAWTLRTFAILHEERGELDKSRALFRRAIAMLDSMYKNNNVYLARPLFRLARLELETKRIKSAYTLARRAWSICSETEGGCYGWMRMIMARVVWAHDRDRGRAQELARGAIELLTLRGNQAKAKEATRWLETL